MPKRAPGKSNSRATRNGLAARPPHPQPRVNEPHPIYIRLEGGAVFPLEDTAVLKRTAMYWAYVVRNRVRWSRDSAGLMDVRQRVVKTLEALGIGEDHLRAIAAAGAVEVDIPF